MNSRPHPIPFQDLVVELPDQRNYAKYAPPEDITVKCINKTCLRIMKVKRTLVKYEQGPPCQHCHSPTVVYGAINPRAVGARERDEEES